MEILDTILGTNEYTVEENKLRIIQEMVPGNQVSLAHIIANPVKQIYERIGIDKDILYTQNAIGIMSVTPPEVSIIAADMSTKISSVQLGSVDRFNGTIIIIGSISDVETAFIGVCDYLKNTLKFEITPITKT